MVAFAAFRAGMAASALRHCAAPALAFLMLLLAAPAFAQQGPQLTKQFLTSSLPGGTVTLRFTITNPNAGPDEAIDNIQFTDTLPGVPGTQLSATGLPANNICGAGSQITGTTTLTFTGGILAELASCTFDVTIQVPADAQPGSFTNTTGTIVGDVSSDNITTAGNSASADLTILGGSITIVKNTAVDGTFDFTGSAGIGNFTLTTSGGTAQVSFANLTAGTFTVSEAESTSSQVTSITCTDPDGGSSVNVASRTATIDLDNGETIICTFANAQRPGTITIVKQTMGFDASFQFSGSSGIGAFTLTTTGGTALQSFSNLTPGTFTIVETQLPGFGELMSITCEDPDSGSTTSVDTATATVDLDGGETVTCIFMNVLVASQTGAIIESFLYRTGTIMLDETPDRVQFFRRFPQAFWPGDQNGNAAGFAAPASFALAGEDAPRQAQFASGLSQVAAAFRATRERKLGNVDGALALLGGAQGGVAPGPQRFDVWTEGRYKYFSDDNGGLDRHGHFAVVYAGVDYLFSPNWMGGMLTQLDWAYDRSEAVAHSKVEGYGWMFGPYVSGRITQHLFLMARAAWGQGYYDISPFNSYTDEFHTDRWLVHASLTGNWAIGSFRVSPNVTVKYLDQSQQGYTDSLGNRIDGRSVSLGRLSAGPEIGYRGTSGNGTVIELQGAVDAIWDFENPDIISVGGNPYGPDDFHVKLKGAVAFLFTSGVRVRAEADYDGIANNSYDAVGGRITVSVPIGR